MKKLILAAMTASLLATPMAASAQSRTVIKEKPGRTIVVQKDGRGQKVTKTVVRPQQARATKWQRGQKFDRNRAANYRDRLSQLSPARRLCAPARLSVGPVGQ